jgi:hypothetical protein
MAPELNELSPVEFKIVRVEAHKRATNLVEQARVFSTRVTKT